MVWWMIRWNLHRLRVRSVIQDIIIRRARDSQKSSWSVGIKCVPNSSLSKCRMWWRGRIVESLGWGVLLGRCMNWPHISWLRKGEMIRGGIQRIDKAVQWWGVVRRVLRVLGGWVKPCPARSLNEQSYQLCPLNLLQSSSIPWMTQILADTLRANDALSSTSETETMETWCRGPQQTIRPLKMIGLSLKLENVLSIWEKLSSHSCILDIRLIRI